jgi:hypothetical protein
MSANEVPRTVVPVPSLASREGWEWFGNAAHLIVSRDCRFHLATLVGPWLISTVGEYFPDERSREIHAEVRGIQLQGMGDARRNPDGDPMTFSVTTVTPLHSSMQSQLRQGGIDGPGDTQKDEDGSHAASALLLLRQGRLGQRRQVVAPGHARASRRVAYLSRFRLAHVRRLRRSFRNPYGHIPLASVIG